MEFMLKEDIQSSELRELVQLTENSWHRLLKAIAPHTTQLALEKLNFAMRRWTSYTYLNDGNTKTPAWEYNIFWSLPLIEDANFEYGDYYSGHMAGAIACFLQVTERITDRKLKSSYIEIAIAPHRHEVGDKVTKRLYYDTDATRDVHWCTPMLAARAAAEIQAIQKFEALLQSTKQALILVS